MRLGTFLLAAAQSCSVCHSRRDHSKHPGESYTCHEALDVDVRISVSRLVIVNNLQCQVWHIVSCNCSLAPVNLHLIRIPLGITTSQEPRQCLKPGTASAPFPLCEHDLGVGLTSIALACDPEGPPLVGREAVQKALNKGQRVPSCPGITCSRATHWMLKLMYCILEGF